MSNLNIFFSLFFSPSFWGRVYLGKWLQSKYGVKLIMGLYRGFCCFGGCGDGGIGSDIKNSECQSSGFGWFPIPVFAWYKCLKYWWWWSCWWWYFFVDQQVVVVALVILVTVVVVVVVRVVLPSAMIHMAHQNLDDCLCIYKIGLWRRFCLWFSFYLCCVGKGDICVYNQCSPDS